MNLKYKLFLFVACSIEVYLCETDVNSTLNSRREILEKQARDAYQNACLRLQELSNWMSVVFKIKGVWASSTVNHLAAKSGEIPKEIDRRNVPSLPPRPKISGSQCSIKSMQVTAQTYAYLQSQLMLLKMLLGRNIVRSSKVKLGDANASLRERMKDIDVFNSTLNNILHKLKQSTQELSDQVNPDIWKPWNIIQNIQGGLFLQSAPEPRMLFENVQERIGLNNSKVPSTGSKTFFQTLGKTLDRIIFPTEEQKMNTVTVDTQN